MHEGFNLRYLQQWEKWRETHLLSRSIRDMETRLYHLDLDWLASKLYDTAQNERTRQWVWFHKGFDRSAKSLCCATPMLFSTKMEMRLSLTACMFYLRVRVSETLIHMCLWMFSMLTDGLSNGCRLTLLHSRDCVLVQIPRRTTNWALQAFGIVKR